MPRRNLKVVKLRKPKVAADTRFIETLVWVLDEARKGNVTGYAIVYTVEQDESVKTIEASDTLHGHQENLIILGGIERMKVNFMSRAWPDED